MKTFSVGDSYSSAKTIQAEDIELFAQVSGDDNPVHLDESFAAGTRFKRRIAHGMLSASLISAILGTKFPGPGTIYLGQSLKFLAPVYIGDTVHTTVVVESFDPVKGKMVLKTICANQDGVEVISGQAEVLYRPF